MISNATRRSILRWIHIVFGIPILGYIYSPFEELPQYAPAVRFVFLPVFVLSGFWMWKGHVLAALAACAGSNGSSAETSAETDHRHIQLRRVHAMHADWLKKRTWKSPYQIYPEAT